MILSGLTGYYVVYVLLTLLFFLLLRRPLFSRKGLVVSAGYGAAVLLGAILPFSLSFIGRLETAVAIVLITLILSYFIARDGSRNELSHSSEPKSAPLPSGPSEQMVLAATALPSLSADSLTDGGQSEDRLVWDEQELALEEIAAAAEQWTGVEDKHAGGREPEPDVIPLDREALEKGKEKGDETWEEAYRDEAWIDWKPVEEESLDVSLLDEAPKEEIPELEARKEIVDDDLLAWNVSDDPLPADVFSGESAAWDRHGGVESSLDSYRFLDASDREEWVSAGSVHEEPDRLQSRFDEELDRVDSPSLTENSRQQNFSSGAASEQSTY